MPARWAPHAPAPLVAVVAANLVVGGLFSTANAVAGGGPENVFLIVNANSDSSKTVANHYIALRQIPPNNVFYVDWRGGLESCNAKVLIDVVLRPAIAAIETRHMAAQIDYLVYSSDFPWRVELKPLFPEETFTENFPPIGSLTGVTYLLPYVIGPKPSPAIVMPSTNWYVPALDEQNLGQCQQLADVPSRGFRSRYRWDAEGRRAQDELTGQRYFLSVCLGVTQGRGNTLAEVIDYLERAKTADGTRPKGTIYFMRNNDIRSQTRHACFAGVAASIQRQGVQARVLEGKIPRGANDVMGIMAGTDSFDIAAAGDKILPGAICEHLTSAGGILRSNSYQTPLSEFLRAGAAGASGTIIEPRAIQAKFPLPSLQLHYARGCSLAEAFYQSVAGPYQLLIVGDPLCQPWATFPTVSVDGVKPNQEMKGTLTLTPSGRTAAGQRIGLYELFIDGRLITSTTEGQTLTLDTTKLYDGYHDLRVVASLASAMETQGRLAVPVTVNNHAAALDFAVAPRGEVVSAATLKVSVRQVGATGIIIRQNSRVVGRVQGDGGDVEIPASLLGQGPTSLQAVSQGAAPTVSEPIAVHVR